MTSTYSTDPGTADWDNRVFWGRLDTEVNVGRTERWISGAAGAVLLGLGLGRRRFRAVLLPLGIGLLHRALTGRSQINRVLRRNSALGEGRVSPVASLDRSEGRKIEQAVTIHRARGELFRFWRQLDNLPRFMDNLESVTVLDSRHSHWVAKGPVGTRVEWDAEIHNEIEDELIAWRSLPGGDVDQAGSVHFSSAADGQTEVRVVMRYSGPGRRAGDVVAHILGDDPERQIADDLRRFRQVMEAGEIGAPMSPASRH
jgi:uncharacterized membrane protein